MSTCRVHVELEHQRHGEASLRCGASVRGHAIVEVDEEVSADAVHVELEWYTHGRGNRAAGVVAQERLAGQRFQPGAPTRLPFELSLPEGGPVTYRGQFTNLDWRVRTRIDLPWKIDPRAEEDFVVVAGPRSTPFRTVPALTTGKVSGSAIGCLTLFIAPFLVMGIGAIVAAFLEGDFFKFIWGVIFSGIPGAILAGLLARRVAQRAVGHAQVGFVPARVEPGAVAEVRVDLPRSLIGRIRKVTCRFHGEEIVVSGSGTDKTTHRVSLHDVDVPMVASNTGTHVRYSGRLHVPPRAAATFAVESNRVCWHAKVVADITGVPDPAWDDEIEVDVVRPQDEG